MNTQELKKYIDRVLGNKIRCLLPSYWWKRLFKLVLDKVDEKISVDDIKTINGESIIGEGDLRVGVKSVESVEELDSLDALVGDIATVGGEHVNEIKARDCYLISSDIEDEWDNMTTIDGVIISEPIGASNILAIAYLVKEDLSNLSFVYSQNEDECIIQYIFDLFTSDDGDNGVLYHNGQFYQSNIDKINDILSTGEYKFGMPFTLDSGITIDDVYDNLDIWLTFINNTCKSDAYIKSKKWEKISKEYIVDSIDKLRSLGEIGTISQVSNKKEIFGDIRNCHIYSDGDSFEDLTILKNVNLNTPDTATTFESRVILTNSISNISSYYLVYDGNRNKITWYTPDGYEELCYNGSVNATNMKSFKKMLENEEWRIVDYRANGHTNTDGISGIDAADIVDTWFRIVEDEVYSKSDAYIKGGDGWEKLSKDYTVYSKEELEDLDVPYGTIAKVISTETIEGSFYDCYMLTDEEYGDGSNFSDILPKLTRISKVKILPCTDYDTSFVRLVSMNRNSYIDIAYKWIHPNTNSFNSSYIKYYGLNGSKVVDLFDDNGNIIQDVVDELNEILAETDLRYNSRGMSPLPDNLDSFILPIFDGDIKVESYIKGNRWEKISKDGEGSKIFKVMLFDMEFFINGSYNEISFDSYERTIRQVLIDNGLEEYVELFDEYFIEMQKNNKNVYRKILETAPEGNIIYAYSDYSLGNGIIGDSSYYSNEYMLFNVLVQKSYEHPDDDGYNHIYMFPTNENYPFEYIEMDSDGSLLIRNPFPSVINIPKEGYFDNYGSSTKAMVMNENLKFANIWQGLDNDYRSKWISKIPMDFIYSSGSSSISHLYEASQVLHIKSELGYMVGKFVYGDKLKEFRISITDGSTTVHDIISIKEILELEEAVSIALNRLDERILALEDKLK